MKFAAQTFTIRKFTQDPEGIATSMHKLRQAGFSAVQLSALGPISVHKLKAILDAEGLEVCATHVLWERLRDDLDAVIYEHEILKCRHAAVGSVPEEYRSAAGFAEFARKASEIGARLQRAGVRLSCHNHHVEMERFNGRCGLEIVMEESDPQTLSIELDTQWVQYGGGDPAQWIRRLAGRVPIVHLRDMSIRRGEIIMANPGEGNMNWPNIFAACAFAGVEWYVIELVVHDEDPFDALESSLRNLQSMHKHH